MNDAVIDGLLAGLSTLAVLVGVVLLASAAIGGADA